MDTKRSKKTPCNSWCYTWLETYKQGIVSAKTYKNYKVFVGYIAGEYGSIPLSKITSEQLQSFLNRNSNFSKIHVHKFCITVKQIFKQAKIDGYINRDPAEYLKEPKAAYVGSRRPISEREREVILEVAKTHSAGVWIRTLLYCRLRPSESVRLQGKHINLQKRILYIEGSKTTSGNRIVPTPGLLTSEMLHDPFYKNYLTPASFKVTLLAGGEIMQQALQQPVYTEEDYNNLPEDVRAELINGQIYYQAVPSRIHQEILSFLHVEISNYIRSKKGECRVYPAPFAVKLQETQDTIVEPDISVICDLNKLTDRGCTGAPDWIIEIVSPSNSSHDYIRKLNLYALAGVREYWIVNPMQKSIYVYHLEEMQFETTAYSFEDKIPVRIDRDFSINFSELTF